MDALREVAKSICNIVTADDCVMNDEDKESCTEQNCRMILIAKEALHKARTPVFCFGGELNADQATQLQSLWRGGTVVRDDTAGAPHRWSYSEYWDGTAVEITVTGAFGHDQLQAIESFMERQRQRIYKR